MFQAVWFAVPTSARNEERRVMCVCWVWLMEPVVIDPQPHHIPALRTQILPVLKLLDMVERKEADELWEMGQMNTF